MTPPRPDPELAAALDAITDETPPAPPPDDDTPGGDPAPPPHP
jgi:hypothetical protein